MIVERIASVPLLVHDPYFSVWSPADRLYEAETMHWSKAPQRLYGHVFIDGTKYRFMGGEDGCPVIEQKSLDISPTATTYLFEHEKLELTVRFLSPLLLEDPVLVSRPCTYIDFTVNRKRDSQVEVEFAITADLVQREQGRIIGGAHKQGSFHYASMRKAFQNPLGHSGDHITIDWGDVYLAANEDAVLISFDAESRCLIARAELEKDKNEASVIAAYDDLISIFYFGSWQKAYWTKTYDTIFRAMAESFDDKKQVISKALAFDRDLEERAMSTGGKDFALLCSISYRHTIGAHKLIEDQNGELVFLSKENDSNGCLGTVDISYPSSPLFFLFNTEYVKAMLRPIFRFADYPVWEYDFAPHDVGRYPYASGQVYGLNHDNENKEYCYDNGSIFPFYYQYPAGAGVYDSKDQMPVEESGNMVILTAAVCTMEGTAEFAEPYYDLLKLWTEYLLKFGADPGEQLCTDDFAGHLSHNVNLSAKAVMGIEAFSHIAGLLGKKEEEVRYHEEAVKMAKSWKQRSADGDHYKLTFDGEGTWSLKYNLVWDKFFESEIFDEDILKQEFDYYLKKTNTYGVPLDSRKQYTKSDWILWCSTFADTKEKAQELIAPVVSYVKNTRDRVPFSDWYETVDGSSCSFIARSVQGGIYMPLLIEKMKLK